MNNFELVLAAILISQPESALELRPTTTLFNDLAPAIRALAQQWELLDQREIHLFTKNNDFRSDLETIQIRYAELRDAPPVLEHKRFPERQHVSELLAHNRSCQQHLVARLALDLVHAEAVRATIKETDHLYKIWDCVRDASCDYYYISVRRQALKQLRTLIGDTNFYSGTMPPHVPVWRLTRLQ